VLVHTVSHKSWNCIVVDFDWTLEILSVLQISAAPSLRDNSAGSRQPPPEQQPKPRAQQQEPDQRVDNSSRQVFVPRALARKQASCRYCCSRRVTRTSQKRALLPHDTSASAWGWNPHVQTTFSWVGNRMKALYTAQCVAVAGGRVETTSR